MGVVLYFVDSEMTLCRRLSGKKCLQFKLELSYALFRIFPRTAEPKVGVTMTSLKMRSLSTQDQTECVAARVGVNRIQHVTQKLT